MTFKTIVSKIRLKLEWNKNLIPNISHTSRSNQLLEGYKLLIEKTGNKPSVYVLTMNLYSKL